MKPLLMVPVVPPPITLAAVLTIDPTQGLRRSLRTNFGLSTRAINEHLDPDMDLIYLSETTLPGSLPCLTVLDQHDVTVVTLRSGYLECLLSKNKEGRRGVSSLANLATGNCFLSANNRKVSIASFTNHELEPTRIAMDVPHWPNLLDYLRTDSFTLEISGINRRRLTKPLSIQAVLEFAVETRA
ncbi:hypothetical protein [Hymenobacter sp. GOD-10R]|uniref:hypothetical protein n=1 Tax=Hymenobacter sp. GOD-10R TaxID=3093922 RepID=UPI002D7740E5|nr:hypothetical protein [Hymenobacter sp. GOD-10R]WRQ27192.1 hypothetical protein SD425_19150 [Hymenobacter sp. GOD-10R]